MNYKVYSWATLSLSALLIFSACANDDIANSENEVTLNGHKLNITINEETFEAEKPTRATQVLHRDTIDMGDGLIAEVSIEPDKTAPTPQPVKTRAAMSEGHYTIYAVDAAGNRVADELSGTVSNGKFIPDANKRIRLDPGTYTFVCHNDEFQKTVTGLEVPSNISTYPMIGTVTKTLSGGDETVSFNMKHLAARFRTQVTTYTAYAKMKNYGTYFTTMSSKYSNMYFDNRGVFTHRPTAGPMSYTHNELKTFNKVGNKPFSPIVEPFEVISPYVYISLAEGENIPANDLIYTINGSYHGKEKQKSITIDTPLERNHTYLVKLTMKTKDPLCLYQDGTVGYAGDKEVGTREPIALVINEKTATEKGMAVALKDAGQVTPFGGYYQGYVKSNDRTDNMEGYEITYTPNYYSEHYTGDRTRPLAETGSGYYEAAHYNPGVSVTGSNVGKWFLPSSGQWTPLLVKYGDLDKTKIPPKFNVQVCTWTPSDNGTIAEESTTPTVPLNGAKLASAFTKAGGSFRFNRYLVSGSTTDYFYGPLTLCFASTKVAWGDDIFVNISQSLVRPFVYY